MKQKHLLAFDCMETIVDLTEIPDESGYARWAYEGSNVEHNWSSFDEFYDNYVNAEKNFLKENCNLTEFKKMDRLRETVNLSNTPVYERLYAAQSLFNNFWKNYMSRCFCNDDVYKVIKDLEKEGLFMVVVSNFTVPYGVHEILSKLGLLESFMKVYSSADIGIRKPGEKMFEHITRDFRIEPERVILLGDDYHADYTGGANFGFKTCLYDRNEKYPHIDERVKNFREYVEYLKGGDFI